MNNVEFCDFIEQLPEIYLKDKILNPFGYDDVFDAIFDNWKKRCYYHAQWLRWYLLTDYPALREAGSINSNIPKLDAELSLIRKKLLEEVYAYFFKGVNIDEDLFKLFWISSPLFKWLANIELTLFKERLEAIFSDSLSNKRDFGKIIKEINSEMLKKPNIREGRTEITDGVEALEFVTRYFLAIDKKSEFKRHFNRYARESNKIANLLAKQKDSTYVFSNGRLTIRGSRNKILNCKD